MKKIALALLLIGSSVRAEPYLEAKNDGGGEIILTTYATSDCKNGLKAMYSSLPNGKTYYGCWAYLNDKIHVRYEDGERRVYALDLFVVKESK